MSTELEISLETEAQEIRQLLKRSAQNIVDIGLRLTRVKEQLKGTFLSWVERELGISPDTAQRFMKVAGRFQGRIEQFSHVDISALYLLASPSTPDEVIQAVESGQIAPDLASIREAKAEYRQPSSGYGSASTDKLSAKDLTKQVIALIQQSQVYESGQIDQADVTSILAKVGDGFWGGKRKKTFTALSLLCQAMQKAITNS